MGEQEVFVLADRAINAVVGQITGAQWDTEMPEWFKHRFDHTPTVREIINYLAYDDAWVPDMLAGRTMTQVGEDAYKGDLLGDDPHGRFGAIVDKACAAAEVATELDQTVYCSFGEYPMRHYFWQISQFRFFRAWDLSLVTGADANFSDDLVHGIWTQLEPVAEEWRSYGIFGPRVEVPDDASLLDRVLALSGRAPHN